jgi:hypothetical protein
VLRRLLPAVLAVIAAVADSRGAHGLAFDALLGAVPFTGVAALEGFGAYLDDRGRRFGGLQALLWLLALTMLVLSCAVRSPATHLHAVPPLATSALSALLGVYCLKALFALAPYARLALRPAKP